MFATSLVALSAGLLLDRPIRPRLQTAAAAAAAPLAVACAPLPASAAMSHVSDVVLTLASRGNGSEGLIASISRDPTDVYFGFLAIVGLLFLVKNVTLDPIATSTLTPALNPSPTPTRILTL